MLTRHAHSFVTLLGSVTGIITRSDIQKPLVRMWLLGMITSSRLKKAAELLEERRHRKQHCDLIDCLQFSDKAKNIIENPENLKAHGFQSERLAKQVCKELESLRNNLATPRIL